VYKVVYFAFGFEAIDSAQMRQETMRRVLGWFVGGGITGTVDLQFRRDDGGAQVSVVGAGISALTGSDGSFVLRGVPDGVYDVEVAMPTYLTARRSGVQVARGEMTELPRVLLRGGDLNLDGRVDALDLADLALNLGLAQSQW
jgi:hypothetical protein